MSGIAGRIELRRPEVDQTLLLRMSALIAHRGPDGEGNWTRGSVGLCHRQFCTTPESLHERQPWTDVSGMVCLTLDGRVDNREELSKALQAQGVTLRCTSDAELVLQAYLCWEEDFAMRIIGDFALAVWDVRIRRLILARDILGMKPLHYFVDGERLLWCSEIRPLFADPAVPREPNERMVGEFLADSITSPSETLYRGIFCLPPAHLLVFDADRPDTGPRLRRYWDIDPAATIRCRDDREYAERLLDVLKEAVRCRLRSLGPVGVELSGGLDSSFVTCLASDLTGGANANGGLESFSLVFPGFACDESEYIDAVVARCGRPSNRLCPPAWNLKRHRDQVESDWLLPDYPNGAMSAALRELAVAKGCRVLLTGLGGDEWFWGSPHHYADLLRTFRIGALLRRACADPAVPTLVPWPSNPLLRWAIGPLLPRPLKETVRNLRATPRVPPWIRSNFARRIALAERRPDEIPSRRFASFAQADQIHAVWSGSYQWQMDFVERSANRPAIEHRHPFHDRRVVEFSLALPEEQKQRAGQNRFVAREAMRGIVPEANRQRATKAEFSHVVVQALREAGGERFFAALKIGDLGWVCGEEAGRMYREMERHHARQTGRHYSLLWPLWRIVAAELWFTGVFCDNDHGNIRRLRTLHRKQHRAGRTGGRGTGQRRSLR